MDESIHVEPASTSNESTFPSVNIDDTDILNKNTLLIVVCQFPFKYLLVYYKIEIHYLDQCCYLQFGLKQKH